MANVDGGARLNNGSTGVESLLEELLELTIRHPVALNLQTLLCVTFIVNVVRGVRENEIRSVLRHELRNIVPVGCVADDELVIAEDPKIRGC